MDELAIRSLDRWLTEQLPLISPRKAAYDHIDYIFDRTIPPADTLTFALQAFNTLIEILEGRDFGGAGDSRETRPDDPALHTTS